MIILVKHDGRGKIYTIDGDFLFECKISEGDVIAMRLNNIFISKGK